MFLLSQKLSSIATSIRDNATRVIFFTTHCKRSFRTLQEEFFGKLTPAEEKEVIEKLKSNKTEFIDINLVAQTVVVSEHDEN